MFLSLHAIKNTMKEEDLKKRNKEIGAMSDGIKSNDLETITKALTNIMDIEFKDARDAGDPSVIFHSSRVAMSQAIGLGSTAIYSLSNEDATKFVEGISVYVLKKREEYMKTKDRVDEHMREALEEIVNTLSVKLVCKRQGINLPYPEIYK